MWFPVEASAWFHSLIENIFAKEKGEKIYFTELHLFSLHPEKFRKGICEKCLIEGVYLGYLRCDGESMMEQNSQSFFITQTFLKF